MFAVLVVVHILVSVCLMAVVLLQSGRGGGLAGVFGESSATQAMFGGRGAATFLTRATSILGGTFFLTSMLLALLTTSAGRGRQSLMQREAQRQGATQTEVPPGGQPPSTSAPTQQQPAAPPAGTPSGTQAPTSGGTPR